MIIRNQQNKGADVPGRLLARPEQIVKEAPSGLQPLKLDGNRDGLLYVPANYKPSQKAPLLLMLHGAGGNALQGLTIFQFVAEATGLVLLAPDSRRQTWDVIVNRRFSSDIAFIDSALAKTFSRYAIDSDRIAIGGFSDGASYALSVGITNGDLFTHVIAFSPGFMTPTAQIGSPRIFISHGTEDNVLPINSCSRKIVPLLENAGYDLVYREFNSGHTIPPDIVGDALEWFVAES